MKTPVLAIGLDPHFADLTAFPGLTPQLVRSYVDAQIEKLRQAGYLVESCLVDGSETSDEVVARALTSQPFACVVIGAGLRSPPQQLLLFERLINLVHAFAPAAKICFNTAGGHVGGRTALGCSRLIPRLNPTTIRGGVSGMMYSVSAWAWGRLGFAQGFLEADQKVLRIGHAFPRIQRNHGGNGGLERPAQLVRFRGFQAQAQ